MEIRQRGTIFEIGGVPIPKEAADMLGGLGPFDEKIKLEWAPTEGRSGVQFRIAGTEKWFEWAWVYDFSFSVSEKLGCPIEVFHILLGSLMVETGTPTN